MSCRSLTSIGCQRRNFILRQGIEICVMAKATVNVLEDGHEN